MLLELKVSNFAIIDKVHIQFENGLNILSGETGAGKSILLKSLALLMGEKALSDSVRSGSEKAVIEGSFDLSQRSDICQKLDEMGIDDSEDTLIVRRVISAQGKSRVYLNGCLSALTNLKEVVAPLIEVTGQSAPLIEMTGQHDNKHLQDKHYHLELLDAYAGTSKLRRAVENSYYEHQALIKQLIELKDNNLVREQRLDFLKYQSEELENFNLNPGDELELENTISKLKNVHSLVEFINLAENTLYSEEDSALVRIYRIIQQAANLEKYDSSLKSKSENLNQAKTLIEECIYELRDYGQQLTIDPEILNKSEQELSLFRKLQKKYGNSIQEILDAKTDIENEISSLESSDEAILTLEKDITQKKLEIKALCTELTNKRTKAAKHLTEAVNAELIELNMKGVAFSIQLEAQEEFSSTGADIIEFMIQGNKKDKKRPLAKFASGGELSRILLSLKRVIGLSDQPRTYLFDEVDTGVSGETAEKVGRKLKTIANGQQVICVTHLPQVAAHADHHFFISKATENNFTKMDVKKLKKKETIKEVARLLSGEKITKASLANAEEMLSTI